MRRQAATSPSGSPSPASSSAASEGADRTAPDRGYLQDFLVTPVLLVVLLSFVAYPILVGAIAGQLDAVTLSVLKGDVSQFMQNFFNYSGLLFSFFASATYSFLYQQQESIYVSLYAEVTEARSLMEQLTLISQNRPSYPAILRSMREYVQELLQGVRSGCPPAVLVAAKPANDPLENILYLTSVGVPSAAYETVRSLRQGATQRKLPPEHFTLLWVLGGLELLAFPLLGAGISTYEPSALVALPGHIIYVQSFVFALLAGGIFGTLQVTQDLMSPTAGLYSLDSVLGELVEGLLDELDRRIASAPSSYEIGTDSSTMKDLPYGKLTLSDASQGNGGLLDEDGFPATPSQFESVEPRSEEFASLRRAVFCLSVGVAAALLFPVVVGVLKSALSAPALLAIREDNNAQWLQNFFTGIGFIFSLFVAQTFGFLYGQQEQIYFALYAEVSEAKALLEQLTLVCRTRPSYGEMLQDLQVYVRQDLQRIDLSPARLLAGGASGPDPLENVLYATSVGVPSYVYETVRGLRQARGARLGATQQKLPDAHFAILEVLGVLELCVFPILAAGCAGLEPEGAALLPGHVLFFHAVLFGAMTSAVSLTLAVLWDLRSPVGETYNLRAILKEMVSGLEQELDLRIRAAGVPHEEEEVGGRRGLAELKAA